MGNFLPIPYGVGNIWTKFQLSGVFISGFDEFWANSPCVVRSTKTLLFPKASRLLKRILRVTKFLNRVYWEDIRKICQES